MLVTNSG